MKVKPTQIPTISNNNFQTKFIHKKPQVNEIKGNKHSKKPTTDDLWEVRQANYFDRHIGTNQQTLSTRSQRRQVNRRKFLTVTV